MNLIVDGFKDNLIPYISNINSTQEMYEALSKLFIIKNVGQITSLNNELRTINMKNDDIVSSYFIRSAFAAGLNSWKDTPRFEQMWNACSQEEAIISLVNNKKEDKE